MLELPNKSEKIQQFAWEPRGSRFALLHGDGSRPTGEAGWRWVWRCACGEAGWLVGGAFCCAFGVFASLASRLTPGVL